MDATSSNSSAEPPSSASGLVWKKRATIATGPTHRRRIWETRCGWYRVVHSRCLYGPRKGKEAIPDVFYAMKLVVLPGRTCWEKISEHRKRGPAAKACEKDARKGRDESQVCDRCGQRPPTHFGERSLLGGESQLCDLCWNHSRRRPRTRRTSTGEPKSATRRELPSSSNQLVFDFSDETRD